MVYVKLRRGGSYKPPLRYVVACPSTKQVYNLQHLWYPVCVHGASVRYALTECHGFVFGGESFMRKMISACLSLLLCFALSVSALAEDGLRAYQETKAYQSGIFSDVAAGSWYEAGVCAVYTRGIMDGTGGEIFAPDQTISWAQAVTIAARLHSAYNGSLIETVEGPWYAPYLAYAAQAGLLPSTCPDEATVAASTITRQELAGLFAKVLSKSDLPALNDQSIPDLDAVSAEFHTAVQEMYAAGIFTGKDGGRFDPNGSATRAEIAVIVSRLLLPAQRISQDSRVNTAMSGQMGNYYQGGFAVQSGDTVYYGFRDDQKADKERYGIIARKADGSMETIYTSDRAPDNLYLDENGIFYFMVWEKLMRLDPALGTAETIYTARGKLDTFQIYDGKIYVLENYSGDSNYPDQWRYRFGCVEDGKLKSLMDGITFDQVSYMDRIHFFNNRAYFLYGDNSYVSNGHTFYNYALWSIDLETGKKGRVVDIDDFDMGEIAFDGATAYALEWDRSDDIPLRIVRFSLLQPELCETMGTLPKEAKQLYSNLIANGGELYYLSSGAHCLWHISKSGEATTVAHMPWDGRTYDYATITTQGVLFHDVSTLRLNDSSVFCVWLNDGTLANCRDFLNIQ